MPFIAQLPDSGEAVRVTDLGEKFNRKQDLECPYCGDRLGYKKAAKTDSGNKIRRAHFWHNNREAWSDSAGGCGKGGESEEHEFWKEAIGELLMERYGTESFYVEHPIGDKFADVAIETPEREMAGITAEYQHRNEGKDYLETTKDYLKRGYALHWVFNTVDTYGLLFD